MTPDPLVIITDRRYHRYRQWRTTRERTAIQGIEDAIILLRTGQFKTIEELAEAMKLTVPQVRWRLRKGRDRGFIADTFFNSFGARK